MLQYGQVGTKMPAGVPHSNVETPLQVPSTVEATCDIVRCKRKANC